MFNRPKEAPMKEKKEACRSKDILSKIAISLSNSENKVFTSDVNAAKETVSAAIQKLKEVRKEAETMLTIVGNAYQAIPDTNATTETIEQTADRANRLAISDPLAEDIHKLSLIAINKNVNANSKANKAWNLADVVVKEFNKAREKIIALEEESLEATQKKAKRIIKNLEVIQQQIIETQNTGLLAQALINEVQQAAKIVQEKINLLAIQVQKTKLETVGRPRRT